MKRKRILAGLLTGAMMFSMSGYMANAEESSVSFPLDEEMSFDLVVVHGSREGEEYTSKIKLLQDLSEQTNVKINLIELGSADAMTNLNAMITAGDIPDAIFSNFINDADASLMASNGLLQPLNDYINEDIMPNFTGRVVAENSDILGVSTMPDGNIYTMAYYNALQGNYLESPFWINKNWVEQAGWKVEDIKTIDDLETVLTYFRDHDMNGNGITDDEVPYVIYQSNFANHTEAFLGLYGIATKDSTYENYVCVKDGEVQFAPLTENWKDAIKKLADWYEKGILWSELYTGTGETYNSMLNDGDTPVVGMYNFKTAPTVASEEYVQLAPVSVEGYETEWYIHPGLKGGKGLFMLTSACEHPEVMMAWLDQLYSFENSIASWYGEEGDTWGYTEDGKVEFYDLTSEEKEEIAEERPSLKTYLGGAVPISAFTVEDYAERIVLSEAEQKQNESYALYESYFTDESWPRPYVAGEDAARLSELRTDIFTTLTLKRAEWVTGVADIDAEYDSFVEDMKKMGIDEFVEIMQKTYDNYLAATK